MLAQYERIAIAGGPHTGKTTLAASGDGRPVIHTDDLIGVVDWAVTPAAVIELCGRQARWILEGVQVPRALRKGLPVDCVVWLGSPVAAVSAKHQSMERGLRTIMAEVRQLRPELVVVSPGGGQ